jgi:proline iminopeptidase
MMVFAGLVIALLGVVVFGLSLHRPARFIHNYEDGGSNGSKSSIAPVSVQDGLAVYRVGEGVPVLLFPYPHGHTTGPMAREALADALVAMGRSVVTFDPPGAYHSTREPVGDMDEMLRSADETFERLGINGDVDVVGHSMGALAALGYAAERPERVNRLVLVGGMSGFPAAARWGLPGSAFSITDPDYWRIVLWGMRVNNGRGSLEMHKKLQNLMKRTGYHDPGHIQPVAIQPRDAELGIPVRMIWNRNMFRRLSYADQLDQISAPTLVVVGRYDTYTPRPCAQELADGIPGARLVVFERSGHSPFVEEPARFREVVGSFLVGDGVALEMGPRVRES